MGVHITYKKDFDENGNEMMIEISREEFDDPIEPMEQLEDQARRLMDELQIILQKIKSQNEN